MREILPGILTWPWFSERHGYDFNGYLIHHPAGNLAVDPVEMDEAVLDALTLESVARIAITNRNHFRAAARLSEKTDAEVFAHPADAPFLRQHGVEVAGELLPGQRIASFQVLDASGKSPGEVALWDEARRTLVVGDACVGNPPGELSLLAPQVIDDLPRLREALRRLAALPVEAVLVGDGLSILQGGQRALRALVGSFP